MGVAKKAGSKLKKAVKSTKVGKAVSSLFGGKKGGRRRSKGPTYWANKVLVEKLKKKYNRLKFGGR